MKKNYFLAALLSFAMISMNAQFTDDMESYTDGQPISGAWWTDWGCGGGVGCAIISSSAQAHDGSLSGVIGGDGTTDAVLDMGNKIFGQWGLDMWVYIPAGKTGYYNYQGTVPIGAGEWIVGNLFFNDGDFNNGPGTGYIDYSCADQSAHVYYDYPEDTWFRIVTNVDISLGIGAATWQLNIDGVDVAPEGTPFADCALTYPTSLGGLDLWSNSPDQEMYFDSFVYQDSFITLGNNDIEAKGFRSAMSNGTLTLRAQENINSVAIYNMLGQQVYNSNVNSMNSTIDMSNMANGTYIVKVNINGTEGSVKVIR